MWKLWLIVACVVEMVVPDHTVRVLPLRRAEEGWEMVVPDHTVRGFPPEGRGRLGT